MGSRAAAEHPIEIHDDAAKALDAGLRPVDHYRQVFLIHVPSFHRHAGNLISLAPRVEVSPAAVDTAARKMGDTVSRQNAGKPSILISATPLSMNALMTASHYLEPPLSIFSSCTLHTLGEICNHG